jgi:DNA-binding response OmpR family regulator
MVTIIVVDDDQVFGSLLKTILEMEGYQVVLVPWPEDVVPAVHEVQPALVLMDVHTGHGDTLGLLQELRSDKSVGDMAVVMTSGMDRSEECLAAGADAFILKPFNPSDLLAKVADLVPAPGGGV